MFPETQEVSDSSLMDCIVGAPRQSLLRPFARIDTNFLNYYNLEIGVCRGNNILFKCLMYRHNGRLFIEFGELVFWFARDCRFLLAMPCVVWPHAPSSIVGPKHESNIEGSLLIPVIPGRRLSINHSMNESKCKRPKPILMAFDPFVNVAYSAALSGHLKQATILSYICARADC